MCHGGLLCMYSGDIKNLFEDMQLIHPTWLTAPPRIYTQIYTDYQKELTKRLEELRKTKPSLSIEEEQLIEKKVLKEFSSILGGKTKYLVTGSAPTPQHVKSFLTKCFNVRVYDGRKKEIAIFILFNFILFFYFHLLYFIYLFLFFIFYFYFYFYFYLLFQFLIICLFE